RIAESYLAGLADTGLTLPHVPSWANPSWHLFVVRSPARDRLQDALRRAGIETLIHYPIPPHLQAAYRDLGFGAGAFPISEAIHREVLSLPIGPHMTQPQIAAVVQAARAEALALTSA